MLKSPFSHEPLGIFPNGMSTDSPQMKSEKLTGSHRNIALTRSDYLPKADVA